MTQTLTGTYSSTVDLDTGSIGVSIALTGAINIGFYGANGIYASSGAQAAYVLNKGSIHAGPDGDKGNAGAGIFLAAYDQVVNEGSVFGGNAGTNSASQGFNGGAGIYFAHGGLFENGFESGGTVHGGTVQGGTGGACTKGQGGTGGAGVSVTGASAAPLIVNTGPMIKGGAGGVGSTAGGDGGVGVVMSVGSYLRNYSAVQGGAAGAGGHATGGTGVALLGTNADLVNNGFITGGGANPTSQLGAGENAGGIGVFAVAGYVNATKFGTISGGGGSATPSGYAGAGGIGVLLTEAATLSNAGTIDGGAGGYGGRIALTNGGAGGAGIYLDGASSAVNRGVITGGAGGYGNYAGGNGGDGAFLRNGSSLTNDGTITGGKGGTARLSGGYGGYGGNGGVGVYLDGGTLVNAGVITGGAGGPGYFFPANADAVVFGSAASTLVVDGISTINGKVVANQAASDTLLMAGYRPSLTGLGSQFTGFTTVAVAANCWAGFSGGNSLSATETLLLNGTLSVGGTLTDNGTTMLAPGGVLSSNGDIQATDVVLTGGALTAVAQGIIELVSSAPAASVQTGAVTGPATGAVTIDPKATLSASAGGTVACPLVDNGTLLTTGGALHLQGALSGTGVMSVGASSNINLQGGGTLVNASGAGTIVLDGTSPYTLGKTTTVSTMQFDVDAGVTLSGAGKLSSEYLFNLGTLAASGGTLTLATPPLMGGLTSGRLVADSGATLNFAGGLPTIGSISGAGTVQFDKASTLDAGLTLTAANIVAAANLTLAAKMNFINAFGDGFTLDASSGKTVTLAGAGDSFRNAGSMTDVGAGTALVKLAVVNTASISVTSGTLSFLGSVSNGGSIGETGATASFAKAVTGNGTLGIGQGGSILLSAGAAAGQTVQFEGLTGMLDLASPARFGGLITDFGGNDRIDLLKVATTGLAFSGGVMKVEDGDATVATLRFVGPYQQADFALGSDGNGGSVLTYS